MRKKKSGFLRQIVEYRTGLMIAAATIGMTVLSGGCGKPQEGVSDLHSSVVQPAPAPAPTPTDQLASGSKGFGYVRCPEGQTSLGGYKCVPRGSFESVCRASEGILIAGTNGGRALCKLYFDYTSPDAPRIEIDVYGGFYYLNPDDPSGRYALQLGIPVRRGDKLTFAASGGWGTATSAIHSGTVNVAGLFSIPYNHSSGLSCYNAVSVAGTLMDPATGYPTIPTASGAPAGPAQNYQGMIAGLLGSDGTRVFQIGAALNELSMENDGYLRVGINAPISHYNCFEYFLTKIIVTHCEDATGTTYPCPQ